MFTAHLWAVNCLFIGSFVENIANQKMTAQKFNYSYWFVTVIRIIQLSCIYFYYLKRIKD